MKKKIFFIKKLKDRAKIQKKYKNIIFADYFCTIENEDDYFYRSKSDIIRDYLNHALLFISESNNEYYGVTLEDLQKSDAICLTKHDFENISFKNIKLFDRSSRRYYGQTTTY